MKKTLFLYLLLAIGLGEPSPKKWFDNTTNEHDNELNIDDANNENEGTSTDKALMITYTVPTGATKMSLGIFDANNNLIRECFGNRTVKPGTYNYVWDGKNAKGEYATKGKWFWKAAYHNMYFEWLGTAFNNSDSATGNTKWTHVHASSISFVGSKAFFFPQNVEAADLCYVFDTAHPHTKMSILGHGTYVTTINSCTDGKLIYVTACYPWEHPTYHNSGFIFVTYAINPTSYSFYNFSAGVNGRSGYMPNIGNVIDTTTSEALAGRGVAVCKNANYLYTGHRNHIHISNKNTGAAIMDLPISGERYTQ